MTKKTLNKDELHLSPNLGEQTSGHQVDYRSYTGNKGMDDYNPWITKLNKHKGKPGETASELEVGLSEVARLFIKRGLTPLAKLVVDKTETYGVASENYSKQIKELMYADKQLINVKHEDFSKINYDNIDPKYIIKKQNEDIETNYKQAVQGFQFLDKMPQGFFTKVMADYRAGKIDVDMESLASILTSSYTLEEDDLHKGNVGFYITVDKNNKCQYTFFKIDHDLMLTDSIMSKKDMRIANINYNKNSFRMTVADMERFPDLKDSGNHYWPTIHKYLVKGDKAYTDKKEREAFASLNTVPEFQRYKWKHFLKHSLMPSNLIDNSLKSALDDKQLDKTNMIKTALVERLSELKLNLINSSQFREYLSKYGAEDFAEIQKDIEKYLIDIDCKNEVVRSEILTSMTEELSNIRGACLDMKKFGEISIRNSIKLKAYEFNEHSNKKISQDDVNFVKNKFFDSNAEGRIYYHSVLKHFQSNGCEDEQLKSIIKAQQASYKVTIKTYDDFIKQANQISTSGLPLKQQKVELLDVLKNSSMKKEDFIRIKNELKQSEPVEKSLKFVNQLQSDFWLIRKIRGTYGKTTTASAMIDEIDKRVGANLFNRFKAAFVSAKEEVNDKEEQQHAQNSNVIVR